MCCRCSEVNTHLLHPDDDHLQLLQVQRTKAAGSGVKTGLTSGTYKSSY
jgi:hypothetical protein